MSSTRTPEDYFRRQAEINSSFSPAAPVDKLALFAGRRNQIDLMLRAISQRGQHVVLFGERGVGKTSLAMIMREIAATAKIEGFKFCSINCTAEDDFPRLWRRVFRELSFTVSQNAIGFKDKKETQRIDLSQVLESVTVKDVIGPEDIRYTLQVIEKSFIIIDEMDRLDNRTVTTLLADTVKTLSDHSVDSTILLVGVADSVDQLVAEHASIERALIQVHMPRMTKNEILELLEKALGIADMKIEPDAMISIADLSRGLPHYAHLLGHHAALAALKHDRNIINQENVQEAMRTSVDQAQASIKSKYHTATSSARKDSLFSRVLLACALTDADELGYFSASDVCNSLSIIMSKQTTVNVFSQHLKDFCNERRGSILQRRGRPRGYRYRFANPLMVPFVILKGHDTGLIGDGPENRMLFD